MESLRLADGCGETTKRREPRGVSGTLIVSPNGINHHAGKIRQGKPHANDKAVERLRAMLFVGQKATNGMSTATDTRRQHDQHRDKEVEGTRSF